MENLTLDDVKQKIIKYHDDLRSNIDIENQKYLMPIEKKLQLFDQTKELDTLSDDDKSIYQKLKKSIDDVYSEYLPSIKRVDEMCTANLDLANNIYTNKVKSPYMFELFKDENYSYCIFFPNSELLSHIR